MNNQIKQIKESVATNIDSLKTEIRSAGLSPHQNILSNIDSTTKNYLLKEADLKRIEQYMNYLAKEADITAQRYEQLVQLDIDRLNLYMTVAIGLLAFMGIFVPLVVNFFGKQDLDEKIKQNNQKVEINEDKMRGTENFINQLDVNAKNSENKITSLEARIPEVTLLVLQYAISSLSNINKRRLFNSSIKARTRYFVETLGHIKYGFERCASDGIMPHQNNGFLKHNIEDFNWTLQRLSIQSDLGRNQTGLPQKLSKPLQYLANCNDPTKLSLYYKAIIEGLDEIISSLNTKMQA